MNSIKISVSVDVKRALLRGHIMEDRVDIEISPETLGEVWRDIVSRLDVSVTPPRLNVVDGHHHHQLRVTGPTAADLLSAWTEHRGRVAEAAKAEAEAEAEAEARKLAEVESALVQFESWTPSAKEGVDVEYVGRDGRKKKVSDGDYVDVWVGVTPLETHPWVPVNSLTNDQSSRYQAAQARIKAQYDQLYASTAPYRLAQATAKFAELDRVAAQKSAAQKAEFAERLSSGYWTRETGGYNERRYGSPWCASVSLASGGKLEYSFGESTAKWGKSGELRVACRPGDIIAWGQKDLRRPGDSTHEILVMREDGGMDEIDAAEAKRRLRAKV